MNTLFTGLLIRKTLSYISRVYASISCCVGELAAVMVRTLAPLRRIVARSLEVLEYRRHSEHPQSFIVHDTLECGHISSNLSWDVLDLLIAYTTNPQVSAKRHRCRPCAQLVAKPKSVQSVAIAAKTGVA